MHAGYLAARSVAVAMRLKATTWAFMEAAIKQALTLDYLTTATRSRDNHASLLP
jgi:hypothetical protein